LEEGIREWELVEGDCVREIFQEGMMYRKDEWNSCCRKEIARDNEEDR
jgi:hypothetical protein